MSMPLEPLSCPCVAVIPLMRSQRRVRIGGRRCPRASSTAITSSAACTRAAFDLSTGALLSAPARESLARYDVCLDGDSVLVTVEPGTPAHLLPTMTKRGDDPRRFVIVGAGAAGFRAAETLRREGFEGDVVIVDADTDLPYDRTDLSKSYLSGDNAATSRVLRESDALAAHDIRMLRARQVARCRGKAAWPCGWRHRVA